jgi:glycerophosphoryl diester phosphodiesterase
MLPVKLERVAHRGMPRERVENTLPGFLLAVERGADAIELDVHVTRDGVVVVHHDPVVQSHSIAETSWTDLSQIDLGGRVRVPRLQDVFDAISDRATVYVELKGAGVEESVIQLARRHGRRFALHSFDHDAIGRVRKSAPDIARGILFDRDTRDPAAQLRRAVAHTQPRDVWPHWSLIDANFVNVARGLDTRVIAWTVNSLEVARRLMSLDGGVDAICTDDVTLLDNL